jgi:hypothetical protein
MSHSLSDCPARQFSATIAFGGAAQTPPGTWVVKDHATLAASGLPARSLMRGSVAPPLTVAVSVAVPGSVALGVSVAVRVPAL